MNRPAFCHDPPRLVHLKNLRAYLDALRTAGELQPAAREVDRHLEIGARPGQRLRVARPDLSWRMGCTGGECGVAVARAIPAAAARA